jgi:hypothetical protein
MVLSIYFPPALRVVEALQPLYASSPTKVKQVAEMVEDTLQAYGRCLLAIQSSIQGPNSPDASRSAESYRSWRTRLQTALHEVEVDTDPAHADAVNSAARAARDLAFTIDKVLNTLGVRCSVVSSGIGL